MKDSVKAAGFMSASILAMCVAQPAMAQTVEEPNEGGTQLEEVIVTAQKRSEKINDVPMSIAAASGEVLVQRGINDPTDLEKLVPGFSYQKSSYGVPVFSLRGVGFYDTTQGVTPAVAVYIDEAPLPFSAMTRGAGLDVERVEVLKGPQGTLFGQNSTGGAINYIAAKPTKALSYGGVFEYGRFNAINAEGFISGPITSTLSARFSVRTEQQDDWQYSYTRDQTLGEKHYIAGRLLLDWEPRDNVRLQFGVTAWNDTSDTQGPQLRELAFQTVNPDAANPVAIAALTGYPLPPDDPRAADWDIGRDFSQDNRFQLYSLRGDIDLRDNLTLTSLTAYSRYRTVSLNDADATNYTSLTIEPHALLASFSQELRLTGDAREGAIQWMLGANYNRSKAIEDQLTLTGGTSHILLGIPFLATYLYNHQYIDTKAVFGSIDIPITEQLSFQGSARYTWEERDFVGCIADAGDGSLAAVFGLLATILSGSPKILEPGQCITLDADFNSVLVRKTLEEDNFSWRGSLNWEPSDDLLVYASIAKGFKAGNFSTIPGLTPEQFDPLLQESILAYEAGFKATLLQRSLQLNGAVFYYDYTDKQLLGSIQNPIFGTLPGSVAIPESRVQGAELELMWRPIDGLRVSGAITYVDSEIESDPPLPIDPYGTLQTFVGEQFPYTPKWQSTVDAQYDFPMGAYTGFVGGSVTYRSEAYSNFGENEMFLLEARTLIDLRAGVESPDRRWRVQVFGRNVTDEHYYMQTARQTDTVLSYVGMPRTYGVQLSYRY